MKRHWWSPGLILLAMIQKATCYSIRVSGRAWACRERGAMELQQQLVAVGGSSSSSNRGTEGGSCLEQKEGRLTEWVVSGPSAESGDKELQMASCGYGIGSSISQQLKNQTQQARCEVDPELRFLRAFVIKGWDHLGDVGPGSKEYAKEYCLGRKSRQEESREEIKYI